MSGRFQAFSHSAYRRYFGARFASSIAANVAAVAVAWQIYDETGDPLWLGLVGAVQFLPSLLLVLATGWAADRFGRRQLMGLSSALQAAAHLGLLAMTVSGRFSPLTVLALVAVLGVGRAFYYPASASLVVNLVPRRDFPNAVSWNATSWQLASVLGPALGGGLTALGLGVAYGAAAAAALGSAALVMSIAKPQQARGAAGTDLKTLLGGFSYVWRTKIVLGAMTLDLFAVLLGGAVALLPVYARDILQIGEAGYGLLRAAPGAGAILMAVALSSVTVTRGAGWLLLGFTAAFGALHIVFGLSTSVWLSVGALALIGAFDMVSVYVREVLVQLWTPDAVRGRVNAVNSIFVGASNQLGEARAGFMAARFGAVFAVVAGGAAAMGVCALWAALFPGLRTVQSLDREEGAGEGEAEGEAAR